MPHRDDLEAAHARIAALERELAEARKQAGETGEPDAARTPPAHPEGLEIEDRPECLRIAWHWTISVGELVASGQRVRLIAEIADAERALFVEHAIERRLGIPDRGRRRRRPLHVESPLPGDLREYLEKNRRQETGNRRQETGNTSD